jgi:hypothetical protein
MRNIQIEIYWLRRALSSYNFSSILENLAMVKLLNRFNLLIDTLLTNIFVQKRFQDTYSLFKFKVIN